MINGREEKGKLGDNLSLDDSFAAMKACSINCLAVIKSVAGSLNHIKQVGAVHGMVNSTSDCEEQAKAMNGASDFVVEVFGEVGMHTRTAIGVANLPLGFVASVYMIVEVE